MKGFKWTLVETFDHEALNEREHVFQHPLRVHEAFTIDGVTYEVEHAEWDAQTKAGRALVKMTRYRIPDTATQFVHKCPAMQKQMDKITPDDLVKFEAQWGAKTVNGWKSGRVKMRHHKSIEQPCKHCGVVFWKEQNLIPDTVDVEADMVEKDDDEYFEFDGKDFTPREHV